jgi:hypothetical protein
MTFFAKFLTQTLIKYHEENFNLKKRFCQRFFQEHFNNILRIFLKKQSQM